MMQFYLLLIMFIFFNSRIFFSFESSCDDTCAAIYVTSLGVVNNIICSQSFAHRFYGGIVPFLAQSCHKTIIISFVRFLLLSYQLKNNLFFFSYTKGPGLKYSLLSVAFIIRYITFKLRIPFFSINHLEGHVFSSFIGREQKFIFPFISFIISGGHTIILKVSNVYFFTILGRKIDDSLGEVFDKVARFFGFLYPGACFLEKEALHGVSFFLKKKYFFNIGTCFNVSTSGLKTYFFTLSQHIFFTKRNTQNISALFQQVNFFLLCCVIKKLTLYLNVKDVFFSGGVSVNNFLKSYIFYNCAGNFFFPNLKYSSDNAAMICITNYFKITNGCFFI